MIFGNHLNIALFYLILLHSKMKESWSFSSTVEPTLFNPMPYFDFDVQRNVTVTIGQTAFLHCRVERLGDKDVSWMRKRDLHIITSGISYYTNDQRFQVIRSPDYVNWTLQIRYPTLRDNGVYECQINTEPKMSLSYTLNVVELKAWITGPTEVFVKSGSEITLTCKLQQNPHDLGTIFWKKGNVMIQTRLHENEIHSHDTNRITVDTDSSEGLTSSLRIRRATQSDNGNYTCEPTGYGKSASVLVNVISGEHPAAMQHNSALCITPMSFLLTFVSMCTVIAAKYRLCDVQVVKLIR